MRYVKWAIWLVLAATLIGFLHYTLPRQQVVRIVDAYEKWVDFGNNSMFWAQPDSGESLEPSRDVRFVDTIRTNGKQLVLRNEDTNWNWPPYFKFNSADISAQAKDLVSSSDNPQWVLIRYYGWRSNWLSVYPNLTYLKPVDSPDYWAIPWIPLVVLALLGWLGWRLWSWWDRFYENRLEPFWDNLTYRFRKTD